MAPSRVTTIFSPSNATGTNAIFLVEVKNLTERLDQVQKLWQQLVDTRAFNQSMIPVAASLSMEYVRFLAWAKTSGVTQYKFTGHLDSSVEGATGRRESQQPPSKDVVNKLDTSITQAVSHIVDIFDETLKVARKKVDRDDDFTRSTHSLNEDPTIVKNLNITLPSFGTRPVVSIDFLPSGTPQAYESPGKKSLVNRLSLLIGSSTNTYVEFFKKQIHEISHWNSVLETLLPDDIAGSLVTQAVPAHILIPENENILGRLLFISGREYRPVRDHARLWQELVQFRSISESSNDAIDVYRRDQKDLLKISGLSASDCGLELIGLDTGQDQTPTTALIEWHSFKDLELSSAGHQEATTRLGEVVHLCSMEDKPASLRTLTSIGFIETSDSFGILHKLPDLANPSTQPVSLHSLLAGDHDSIQDFPTPSPDQRLSLAQKVASLVYSLHLTRLPHHAIDSHNTIFFHEVEPPCSLNLTNPYLTNFRILPLPSSSTKDPLSKSTFYHHPDLWSSQSRQTATFKHDIFALGLLLLEIGFWATIPNLIPPTSPDLDDSFTPTPHMYKEMILEFCEQELAVCMGTRYRDVVYRCLAAGDRGSDDAQSQSEGVYWAVVMELVKCR